MAQRPKPPLSRSVTLPAPIRGWNARDQLEEMEPTDAVVLDNWVPDEKGVRSRRGYTSWATGLVGTYGESLMSYNATGSNPKLFVGMPARIYDVTSAGAGTLAVSGLSNGRWSHTMFSTPAGQFLIAANGADAVYSYDNSTWSNPAITGVTPSLLNFVFSHVERLFFIEQGTLNFWYLPATQIAGAATKYPLGAISRKGGQLIALASWSRDGGSGLDDFFIAVTSEGEMFVYQGSDPSATSTWGLVGRFDVPPPNNNRCFVKLGADLAYMCSEGLFPLPQFLSLTSAGVESISLTNRISGAFRKAARTGADYFGWQVLEYPSENLLFCNVPDRERVRQRQFVMNLRTGAWCRFTGMNAGAWGLNGKQMYFAGNDGVVYAYGANTVYQDAGSPITASAMQAYNKFGSDGHKLFVAARPMISGPQNYVPDLKISLDYNETMPSLSPNSATTTGPKWNSIKWDTTGWAASQVPLSWLFPLSGEGFSGALALGAIISSEVKWNATQVLYQYGRNV